MNNNVNTQQAENIRSVFCGIGTLTAAGTGDATAVTGATIDSQITLTGKGGQGKDIVSKAGAIKFVVQGTSALTAAKTLSLAVEYQESSDGSSWDTAVALRANAVWNSTTGASTCTNLEYTLPLASRKRYIRLNYTPDLSHTSTDTAIVSATALLLGATANQISR
jgi:hypothetical protein